MIPLATPLIHPLAHPHAGDAASPQKDAPALSDRLRAAVMHTDGKHADQNAATDDDINPVMQMLLDEFKQQVLMPDSDDPQCCPALDPNASW